MCHSCLAEALELQRVTLRSHPQGHVPKTLQLLRLTLWFPWQAHPDRAGCASQHRLQLRGRALQRRQACCEASLLRSLLKCT